MVYEQMQKALQEEQSALGARQESNAAGLPRAPEFGALRTTPGPRRHPARFDFNAPLLTPRECEALELVARGFSCAEIARLQQVSVHTTRSHLKSIYAKLGVHSKSEAVFEATASGLLRPDFWTTATQNAAAVRHPAANQGGGEQLVAHGG